MHAEHFPRHSLAKKIALILGGILVLAGIAVGSLPWILSTKMGSAWVFKQLSLKTGIEMQAKGLYLNWFGSQELLDVHGSQKENQLQFSCPQISTSASLWQVLYHHNIGHLELKNPSLTLSKPFKPSVSIKQHSIQAAGMLPEFQLNLQNFSWKGEITIQNGIMKFDAPNLDLLEFEKIELHLDLSQTEIIRGSLNCLATQKGMEGTLELTASLSKRTDYTLHALIQKLPTRGVDQLLGIAFPEYNGLFYQLIGPTLDLQCSLTSQAESASIHLEALSPLVKMNIDAQSLNGFLTLTQPAKLDYQITPSLVAKLSKKIPSLQNLTLTNPTQVQAHIEQWKSPLPFDKTTLSSISFQADLTLLPKTEGFLKTLPFIINSFALSGKSPSLQEAVSWSGSCEIAMQDQVGSFIMDATLSHPLSKGREGTLSLTTKQFPLTFMSGIGWEMEPLFGKTVDMTGLLSLNEKQPQLSISWDSPLFKLPSFTLSLKEAWQLTSPATFTYQPNNILIKEKGGILSELTPIQGAIQRFELAPHNWQGLQLEASLSVEKLLLKDPLSQPISNLQLLLSTNTLNKVILQVKSDTLNGLMSGTLNTEKNTFSLTQPLTAQYVIDLPQLAKKTNLQLAIDPFTFFLADPLSNGLKGQIFCAEAALNTTQLPVVLQNTALPFVWNEKAQLLTLQIASQAKGEEQTLGSIQGQLSCSPKNGGKKLEINTASLQGRLNLYNLSSELIDILVEKPYISLLIGRTFSADFNLNSTLSEQNLSVKWTSPNLNFDSSFTLNKTGLKLQSPSPISWNLTPESYRVLDRLVTKERQTAFGLNAPSHFTLSLSKLFLPVTVKKEVQLLSDRFFPITFASDQLELVMSASNPNLEFIDKSSKEMISLSNLSSSIHKVSGQTPFTITLDSAISTQNGQGSKSGSLTLSARVDLPQGEKGFDLSKLNAAIQLQAKQIPSRALDLFARASGRTDQPFTTLFGSTVHLTLNTDLKELNGPIQFNLNTPTAQAELNGHLVNGALLLDHPFFSQLLVTRESSQLLLKEINPLDLSYIYSHAPVTLNIPKEEFYLPLYPWIPAKMNIPDASLELGKVACRNEGNINITLGLLKSKQFNKNQDLTLWFAPIDLSIKQGIANIQRTELLISDTFDICTWGTIDLVKEYVDMTLGLTAQTLSAAFGIKNLPENYVLTIPMKGKMDNVQINTGKATTKVALLLAWQHKDVTSAFGSGAGKAGALVGDLLGTIAQLPDAKAQIPPPKHPFPWEAGQEKKPSSSSKKKVFKTSDKPLKQILKVIR